MKTCFWDKLSKPVLALAPMANVTDAAFRRLIAKYGKPDVAWTEFVSADGLCSSGRQALLVDLTYSESERPIVAQLFGGNPETMSTAAKLIRDLGFDGIDINMGCPDRNVEKQGAGAALIKNPGRAKELIYAAREGGGGLPVSVKTRIGYSNDATEEWVGALLEAEPALIALHARTRREMSDVPARWDAVARAVRLRDSLRAKTLIIGNGDIGSVAEAREKAAETGADGIMIGRGIFGNPWCFSGRSITEVRLEERLRVLVEHILAFDELLGEHKSFAVMKKHFKAYIQGFDGAKELRTSLMETETALGAIAIIKKYGESGEKSQ